jgi:hypothetical protein
MDVVLPVLGDYRLERELQAAVSVLLNVADVNVLDRKVVVIEPERPADRVEIGLAQRGAERILVLDLTFHRSDGVIEQLDRIVLQGGEDGRPAAIFLDERGHEFSVRRVVKIGAPARALDDTERRRTRPENSVRSPSYPRSRSSP